MNSLIQTPRVLEEEGTNCSQVVWWVSVGERELLRWFYYGSLVGNQVQFPHFIYKDTEYHLPFCGYKAKFPALKQVFWFPVSYQDTTPLQWYKWILYWRAFFVFHNKNFLPGIYRLLGFLGWIFSFQVSLREKYFNFVFSFQDSKINVRIFWLLGEIIIL